MTGILLVEDRLENRNSYAILFKRQGFEVYEAEGYKDAINFYQRAASKISGVITDIRLDESKVKERAGTELARTIRVYDKDIPIIGISAFDLDQPSDDVFNLLLKKSSTDSTKDFLCNISNITNIFEDYEAAKFSDAPVKLMNFKKKYSISDKDFKYLISSIPLSEKLSETMINLHEIAYSSQDDSVKDIDLEIIEPDSKLGNKYNLKKSLPIVIVETLENVFLAEVYTLPTIFTYGQSREEATNLLLDSLTDYSSELEDIKEENLDIIKFGRFLKGLFNA